MTEPRPHPTGASALPWERDTLRPAAVLAVCGGTSGLAQVEHDLLDLCQALGLPLDGALATHPMRDQAPHWAGTLAVPPHDVDDLRVLLTRAGGHQGAARCVGVFSVGGVADEPLVLVTGQAAHAGHVAAAAASHLTASGGRLMRFAGQDQVPDEIALGDLLSIGCIDDVRVVGDGPVDRTLVLRTRGHLRPQLSGGRVELLIERYDGTSYIPYERPTPHQCCALH